MSASPEVSLPRTVFYMTMIFSVAWILGAQIVMNSEIDPRGREVSALENSVWIQQQRANEAQQQAAPPADVMVLATASPGSRAAH